MGVFQNIGVASDRVFSSLVSALEVEFGRGAGLGLAQRFLEAEEIDFHWDARISERWVGAYARIDEDDVELERIAVLGFLYGEYFLATMIVDGDGNAHGMMGRRVFSSQGAARRAFTDA
ncbi:hypothetical protein [Sphingopyxis terrae]|uniref:Uncharacterized protein n=2 Tax=Sphingopyxis terrae TaxID=33052 RepID=A0A1Y6FN52_9SPHN|nr:hypothetical protein CPA46_11070 [Sphingopyxis terrae subsp. ummariensis]SMQ76388.1 hypothetical protein SAMN06295984_1829 [Sphingopyxis terrae subsp. ummariensis]